VFCGGRLPRRLPAAQRDRYFAEMSQLAVLMGVPREWVPVTAAQVDAYYGSIADKFRPRRGFRREQSKTAAALVVPSDWGDVPKTLGDIALLLSTAVALAVLPRPSRRLHGVPAAADPLLRTLYVASIPCFALLRLPVVGTLALRWYLGAADTETLAAARAQLADRCSKFIESEGNQRV